MPAWGLPASFRVAITLVSVVCTTRWRLSMGERAQGVNDARGMGAVGFDRHAASPVPAVGALAVEASG